MVPRPRGEQNVIVEERALIEDFLSGEVYAVAGASTDRSKYGNKVLRCYQQAGRRVIPLNPRAMEVEGLPCIAELSELEIEVHGLSIITPPGVTEGVIEAAARQGIERVWVQPGAEYQGMEKRCAELGLSCISGGACLLVVLGFSESL